ncbi:SDR family NAD(P)-dependent oxidoreductase [Nostoc sp.]|uniref:SDR family NAD(P)-dependent oxidoreductase n=1 Tax=Nostoc sp. TaxID=1180 RepID=UPI002FFC388D
MQRLGLLWGQKATAQADQSFMNNTQYKGIIGVIKLVNIIRHFVPAMVKNKQGIIVNFSSGWGRSTSAQVAPYCASK